MPEITNPYPCSVEIKNDTKDAPQYAIKGYCAPGEERETAVRMLAIEGEVRYQLGLQPRLALPDMEKGE